MKKTIRIPVIIDANGKWAAGGCSSLLDGKTAGEADESADWQFLDEMADHETPLVNPRRTWVTVEIELPATLEITGSEESHA